MLQLPTTSPSAVEIINPGRLKRRRTTRAKPSRLDNLIADFKSARSTAVLAEQKYTTLCQKFPGIVEHAPDILIVVTEEGEKVYGNTLDDIDRNFPASADSWTPDNEKRRAELYVSLKEARSERSEEQRKHGLTAAMMAMYKTRLRQKRAFTALCRYRPATLVEARTAARFVRKWLPRIATDIENRPHNIFGLTYGHEAYEGWKEARSSAFDYLAMLTLAHSRAGSEE